MADPLTITTAVTTFLKTAVHIGLQIKGYKDGLDAVGIKVETICHQIDCVDAILRSLQATFDASLQDYIKTATGHIGSHCRDLERSLQDGERTLEKLLRLVVDIHGRKKERGRIGKDYKLRELSDQLAALRERLSNNLGVLQISFAAIQSWRQEMWFQSVNSQTTKIDESATLLRDAVSKYHKEGRDLLVVLNGKLDKLPAQAPEVPELKNLKACLHSGWKVVAEVSTVKPDVADNLLPVEDEEDLDALFGHVDDGGIRDWIHAVQTPDLRDDDEITIVPSDNGESIALEPFDADIARGNADALFEHSKEKHKRIRWKGFDREHEEQLIECEGLLARVRATGSANKSQAILDDNFMLEILDALYEMYSLYRKWKQAAAVMEKKVAIVMDPSTAPTPKPFEDKDLEMLWAAHFRAGNWKQAGIALEKLRKHRALDRIYRRKAEAEDSELRLSDARPLSIAVDVSFDIKQAATHMLQGNLAGAKTVLQDAIKEHPDGGGLGVRTDLMPVYLMWLQFNALSAHLSSTTGDKIQHRADMARYRQAVNKRMFHKDGIEVVSQEWDPAMSVSWQCAELIPRINILVFGMARNYVWGDRGAGASTAVEILFGKSPDSKPAEHFTVIMSENLVHMTDHQSQREQREILNATVYYMRRQEDPLATPALRNVQFDFGIVLISDDDCACRFDNAVKDRNSWQAGIDTLKTKMPLICVNVVSDQTARTLPLKFLPQMVARRPHPTKARYLAMHLGALQLLTGTKADLSRNRDIFKFIVDTVQGRIPKKQSGLLSRRAAAWIDILDWSIWMTPFYLSILAGACFGRGLFLRSLLVFVAARIGLWLFVEVPRGVITNFARKAWMSILFVLVGLVVTGAAMPSEPARAKMTLQLP